MTHSALQPLSVSRRPVETKSKATIQLPNGWVIGKIVQVRPDRQSARFSNPTTGFTAFETFHGPTNKRLGIIVRDASGKEIGCIQSVSELPS